MYIVNFITNIGSFTLNVIQNIGKATVMLALSLFHKPRFKKLPLLIRQIYVIGVQSVVIIVVSGLFIGMVLALQGYNILVDFGATSNLGTMVSLSILRELGPVVTALLFAGRAGSALTSELGLMQSSEQLSSLEVMAIDPLKEVIAPRFWAGVISMPLLSILFATAGIYGGYVVGVEWLRIDSGDFWSILQSNISWGHDIGYFLIKSFVFAVVIIWISLYRGLYAVPNPEGISLATTQTVVQSSLAILALDFLLTTLMFG